jgi:hypothetical protein
MRSIGEVNRLVDTKRIGKILHAIRKGQKEDVFAVIRVQAKNTQIIAIGEAKAMEAIMGGGEEQHMLDEEGNPIETPKGMSIKKNDGSLNYLG